MGWVLGCVCLLFTITPSAWAQETPSREKSEPLREETSFEARHGYGRHRVVYSSINFIRYNALGLISDLDVGYRYMLYDSEHPLFKPAYVGVSFSPLITPAFGMVGGTLKVNPLAVLELSARVGYVSYFGVLDALQSFDSPTTPISDSILAQRGEDGRHYATEGLYANMSARLQGKVGPVILRSTLQMVYQNLATRGEGPQRVFYDQGLDVVQPNDGWVFYLDTDLIWKINPHLLLGVRYTGAFPHYEARHRAPGEERGRLNETHKLGPLAAYVFLTSRGQRSIVRRF